MLEADKFWLFSGQPQRHCQNISKEVSGSPNINRKLGTILDAIALPCLHLELVRINPLSPPTPFSLQWLGLQMCTRVSVSSIKWCIAHARARPVTADMKVC